MKDPKNPTKKKKIRLKPLAMDLACFIGGLVIGEVIAAITQNIGFLKWLSYDVAFGLIEPVELNFVLFKLAFGFSIHLNPAAVIFSLLALAIGRYMMASSAAKKQSLAEEAAEDEEDQ